MSDVNDLLVTEPEPVDELPKTRKGGSTKFEPLLERLTGRPDVWHQLTQETDKANQIANNLRQGIGAPSARYDRASVEHMGEVETFPVPGDFEVKSVGTGEKSEYTRRDGNTGERTIGRVYARYLTPETRDEVIAEDKARAVARIEKRLENGDS